MWCCQITVLLVTNGCAWSQNTTFCLKVLKKDLDFDAKNVIKISGKTLNFHAQIRKNQSILHVEFLDKK